VPGGDQLIHNMTANKTGSSGDQHSHPIVSSWFS
jgi:hypothetical protein